MASVLYIDGPEVKIESRALRLALDRRDISSFSITPVLAMSTFQPGTRSSKEYVDPTSMPPDVPKVAELGVTSAPLKSAAFFIGAYCKEFNEDFMLCKNENRDPAHCLKEGRRVTRCATDLINKMRENCSQQFEAHWNCLERNNQVKPAAVMFLAVRSKSFHRNITIAAEHVPLAGSYENHSRFTSRPETHSRSGEPDLQVYAEVDHHLASNRLRNGYLIPKHSNYWILPYVISGQPKQPLTVSKEFNNLIGRNQNPWKEVNFDALKARPGVPFIRRRSGGGTVYHDLGNTNFSIHLPRQSFDRHVTARVILRAVRSMGIDACINERNDICIGKDKMSLLGSAYKIVNTRAYHHGTMLISTCLNDLGDILRVNKETMITKGVASVRSPVCNIQQSYMNVNHASFAAAVVSEFRKEYKISEEVVEIDESDSLLSIDYIKNGMNELLVGSDEFTYALSVPFWRRVDWLFRVGIGHMVKRPSSHILSITHFHGAQL
ncbi:hypothetical protein Ac2012v2_004258 [Leucoagaricus gongylophorus]